jgi:hypothetical protein
MNYQEFAQSEERRVLSEFDRIMAASPERPACPNHADEATIEDFDLAAEALIDPFCAAVRKLG